MYHHRPKKEDNECQTELQCTPFILSENQTAHVHSSRFCQTEIQLSPRSPDSDLYQLIPYIDEDDIEKNALQTYIITSKRKTKLQFILPITDSSTITLPPTEPSISEYKYIITGAYDTGVTYVKDDENLSVFSNEDFHKVEQRRTPRSPLSEDEVESKSSNTTLRSAFKKVHKEEVTTQTDLMISPHILNDTENAIISINTSCQTSLTCSPATSVTNIVPMLKCYWEHRGQIREGFNKTENVLDILKDIIQDVINIHQHMFEPNYNLPLMDPVLVKIDQDASEMNDWESMPASKKAIRDISGDGSFENYIKDELDIIVDKSMEKQISESITTISEVTTFRSSDFTLNSTKDEDISVLHDSSSHISQVSDDDDVYSDIIQRIKKKYEDQDDPENGVFSPSHTSSSIKDTTSNESMKTKPKIKRTIDSARMVSKDNTSDTGSIDQEIVSKTTLKKGNASRVIIQETPKEDSKEIPKEDPKELPKKDSKEDSQGLCKETNSNCICSGIKIKLYFKDQCDDINAENEERFIEMTVKPDAESFEIKKLLNVSTVDDTPDLQTTIPFQDIEKCLQSQKDNYSHNTNDTTSRADITKTDNGLHIRINAPITTILTPKTKSDDLLSSFLLENEDIKRNAPFPEMLDKVPFPNKSEDEDGASKKSCACVDGTKTQQIVAATASPFTTVFNSLYKNPENFIPLSENKGTCECKTIREENIVCHKVNSDVFKICPIHYDDKTAEEIKTCICIKGETPQKPVTEKASPFTTVFNQICLTPNELIPFSKNAGICECKTVVIEKKESEITNKITPSKISTKSSTRTIEDACREHIQISQHDMEGLPFKNMSFYTSVPLTSVQSEDFRGQHIESPTSVTKRTSSYPDVNSVTYQGHVYHTDSLFALHTSDDSSESDHSKMMDTRKIKKHHYAISYEEYMYKTGHSHASDISMANVDCICGLKLPESLRECPHCFRRIGPNYKRVQHDTSDEYDETQEPKQADHCRTKQNSITNKASVSSANKSQVTRLYSSSMFIVPQSQILPRNPYDYTTHLYSLNNFSKLIQLGNQYENHLDKQIDAAMINRINSSVLRVKRNTKDKVKFDIDGNEVLSVSNLSTSMSQTESELLKNDEDTQSTANRDVLKAMISNAEANLVRNQLLGEDERSLLKELITDAEASLASDSFTQKGDEENMNKMLKAMIDNAEANLERKYLLKDENRDILKRMIEEALANLERKHLLDEENRDTLKRMIGNALANLHNATTNKENDPNSTNNQARRDNAINTHVEFIEKTFPTGKIVVLKLLDEPNEKSPNNTLNYPNGKQPTDKEIMAALDMIESYLDQKNKESGSTQNASLVNVGDRDKRQFTEKELMAALQLLQMYDQNKKNENIYNRDWKNSTDDEIMEALRLIQMYIDQLNNRNRSNTKIEDISNAYGRREFTEDEILAALQILQMYTDQINNYPGANNNLPTFGNNQRDGRQLKDEVIMAGILILQLYIDQKEKIGTQPTHEKIANISNIDNRHRREPTDEEIRAALQMVQIRNDQKTARFHPNDFLPSLNKKQPRDADIMAALNKMDKIKKENSKIKIKCNTCPKAKQNVKVVTLHDINSVCSSKGELEEIVKQNTKCQSDCYNDNNSGIKLEMKEPVEDFQDWREIIKRECKKNKCNPENTETIEKTLKPQSSSSKNRCTTCKHAKKRAKQIEVLYPPKSRSIMCSCINSKCRSEDNSKEIVCLKEENIRVDSRCSHILQGVLERLETVTPRTSFQSGHLDSYEIPLTPINSAEFHCKCDKCIFSKSLEETCAAGVHSKCLDFTPATLETIIKDNLLCTCSSDIITQDFGTVSCSANLICIENDNTKKPCSSKSMLRDEMDESGLLSTLSISTQPRVRILDEPKYIYESYTSAIEGTSKDVMYTSTPSRKIAEYSEEFPLAELSAPDSLYSNKTITDQRKPKTNKVMNVHKMDGEYSVFSMEKKLDSGDSTTTVYILPNKLFSSFTSLTPTLFFPERTESEIEDIKQFYLVRHLHNRNHPDFNGEHSGERPGPHNRSEEFINIIPNQFLHNRNHPEFNGEHSGERPGPHNRSEEFINIIPNQFLHNRNHPEFNGENSEERPGPHNRPEEFINIIPNHFLPNINCDINCDCGTTKPGSQGQQQHQQTDNKIDKGTSATDIQQDVENRSTSVTSINKTSIGVQNSFILFRNQVEQTTPFKKLLSESFSNTKIEHEIESETTIPIKVMGKYITWKDLVKPNYYSPTTPTQSTYTSIDHMDYSGYKIDIGIQTSSNIFNTVSWHHEPSNVPLTIEASTSTGNLERETSTTNSTRYHLSENFSRIDLPFQSSNTSNFSGPIRNQILHKYTIKTPSTTNTTNLYPPILTLEASTSTSLENSAIQKDRYDECSSASTSYKNIISGLNISIPKSMKPEQGEASTSRVKFNIDEEETPEKVIKIEETQISPTISLPKIKEGELSPINLSSFELDDMSSLSLPALESFSSLTELHIPNINNEEINQEETKEEIQPSKKFIYKKESPENSSHSKENLAQEPKTNSSLQNLSIMESNMEDFGDNEVVDTELYPSDITTSKFSASFTKQDNNINVKNSKLTRNPLLKEKTYEAKDIYSENLLTRAIDAYEAYLSLRKGISSNFNMSKIDVPYQPTEPIQQSSKEITSKIEDVYSSYIKRRSRISSLISVARRNSSSSYLKNTREKSRNFSDSKIRSPSMDALFYKTEDIYSNYLKRKEELNRNLDKTSLSEEQAVEYLRDKVPSSISTHTSKEVFLGKIDADPNEKRSVIKIPVKEPEPIVSSRTSLKNDERKADWKKSLLQTTVKEEVEEDRNTLNSHSSREVFLFKTEGSYSKNLDKAASVNEELIAEFPAKTSHDSSETFLGKNEGVYSKYVERKAEFEKLSSHDDINKKTPTLPSILKKDNFYQNKSMKTNYRDLRSDKFVLPGNEFDSETSEERFLKNQHIYTRGPSNSYLSYSTDSYARRYKKDNTELPLISEKEEGFNLSSSSNKDEEEKVLNLTNSPFEYTPSVFSNKTRDIKADKFYFSTRDTYSAYLQGQEELREKTSNYQKNIFKNRTSRILRADPYPYPIYPRISRDFRSKERFFTPSFTPSPTTIPVSNINSANKRNSATSKIRSFVRNGSTDVLLNKMGDLPQHLSVDDMNQILPELSDSSHRILETVHSCEQRLQPIKSALKDIKTKLKELNMPEVDGIFQNDQIIDENNTAYIYLPPPPSSSGENKCSYKTKMTFQLKKPIKPLTRVTANVNTFSIKHKYILKDDDSHVNSNYSSLSDPPVHSQNSPKTSINPSFSDNAYLEQTHSNRKQSDFDDRSNSFDDNIDDFDQYHYVPDSYELYNYQPRSESLNNYVVFPPIVNTSQVSMLEENSSDLNDDVFGYNRQNMTNYTRGDYPSKKNKSKN